MFSSFLSDRDNKHGYPFTFVVSDTSLFFPDGWQKPSRPAIKMDILAVARLAVFCFLQSNCYICMHLLRRGDCLGLSGRCNDSWSGA